MHGELSPFMTIQKLTLRGGTTTASSTQAGSILSIILGQKSSHSPIDILVFIDGTVQNRVSESVLNRITSMPAGEIEKDSLECYINLYECKEVPAPLHSALDSAIPMWIDEIVERDPTKWTGYCLKPLDVIHSPQSRFYERFSSLIEINLDYEINHQCADGSWAPNWNWGGTYPEQWEIAKKKWTGVLTMQRLCILKEFDRIMHG